MRPIRGIGEEEDEGMSSAPAPGGAFDRYVQRGGAVAVLASSGNTVWPGLGWIVLEATGRFYAFFGPRALNSWLMMILVGIIGNAA
ncbi:hypothetical protein TRIUR3_22751 [Triticum urartu]|uniref:Uncharacterized protein n=1 Tax=Triticum urartu TaxID=4572 RepID=M7YQX2_TRIUA|nr:hypothetical protein TRIUR3_22751 [Triticum urartu]